MFGESTAELYFKKQWTLMLISKQLSHSVWEFLKNPLLSFLFCQILLLLQKVIVLRKTNLVDKKVVYYCTFLFSERWMFLFSFWKYTIISYLYNDHFQRPLPTAACLVQHQKDHFTRNHHQKLNQVPQHHPQRLPSPRLQRP